MTSLCAGLVLAAVGQAPPADPLPQFRSGLDATGLFYGLSSSGVAYLFNFDHGAAKRTVYVNVRPSRVADGLMHSIYTNVWVGDAKPSKQITKLLFWGNPKKVGHFYLVKPSEPAGRWAIRFGSHYDATDLSSSPKPLDKEVVRLKDLIGFVDQVGEEAAKSIAELGA